MRKVLFVWSLFIFCLGLIYSLIVCSDARSLLKGELFHLNLLYRRRLEYARAILKFKGYFKDILKKNNSNRHEMNDN
ncbi:hypothetical protein D3Z45_19620 [Lachnospiraceae bacterium]|nr:hypothetical protein [Lachnospiraceae bacterium]